MGDIDGRPFSGRKKGQATSIFWGNSAKQQNCEWLFLAERGSTNITGSRKTKSKSANGQIFDLCLLNNLVDTYRVLTDVSLPGVPPWYYRLPLSLAVGRWRLSWSHRACHFFDIWPADAFSTWLGVVYTVFVVMLSAMTIDSESIKIPDSKKKFFCVNCGLVTNYCAKNKTPRTSLSGMSNRSKQIKVLSAQVIDQWTTIVVTWNTSNKTIWNQRNKC